VRTILGGCALALIASASAPARAASSPPAHAEASTLGPTAAGPPVHIAPLEKGSTPASGRLRVCADPNNMPFSNARGEGIDNALARLVAHALGARLEYTWLPQRQGYVRKTLTAGRCDVLMEAPVGWGRAMTTAPYYRSRYVFVTRRDRGHRIRSFDDPTLRRSKVGIQIVGDDYANPPAAEAMARRGLWANAVGFPVYGDYGKPDPLAPIVQAVANGAVDVAVVWGPVAGWFAKQSPVPLSLTPITGERSTQLPFTYEVAMGVRRDDQALQRRLDGVIRTHRREIEIILRRFGVP
jgi:mxaJ protein